MDLSAIKAHRFAPRHRWNDVEHPSGGDPRCAVQLRCTKRCSESSRFLRFLNLAFGRARCRRRVTVDRYHGLELSGESPPDCSAAMGPAFATSDARLLASEWT